MKDGKYVFSEDFEGTVEKTRLDEFRKKISSFEMTCKADLYFSDLVLAGKFLAHQTVDCLLQIALPDSGKILSQHAPALHITKESMDVGGSNQDVMENVEFEAQVGPDGYTVQYDLI